jgi:DNA-binding NtrC family response regulator
MVFGFVKDMKGKIKVTSELGKGTTFNVYFARAAGLQEMQSPTLVPAENPAPGNGRETILVVDDDDMVRKSVVAQIKSLGYGTIEARSPDEALEVISGKEPIDLLFSDVVMPGPIDGVELARLSREHRPNLKVLLTSGYPDLKTARSSTESYVQWDILKKPYRRNDLQQALKEVLAAREQADPRQPATAAA